MSCTRMGLKFMGILGKSWAVSHSWEELGWAHPYYSHSFIVQFGCACRKSFVLVVPLTLLLLVAPGQKASLKHTAGWWTLIQLRLGTTIRGIFIHCQSEVCPHCDPGKSLCPSLSDIKQKAWHNLGMPQVSSATTGVSKSQEIIVAYRWYSELQNIFLYAMLQIS